MSGPAYEAFGSTLVPVDERRTAAVNLAGLALRAHDDDRPAAARDLAEALQQLGLTDTAIPAP